MFSAVGKSRAYPDGMVTLILLVFGFVLFVLAGFSVPAGPRWNLIGLGLACVTLAEILSRGAPLLGH